MDFRRQAGGLANPQLAAPAAFVGSLVVCLQELEESFPGFTQMLKDEKFELPNGSRIPTSDQ